MKEIYLIRHAETEYNVKKIVQGRGVDSSINTIGKQQSLAFFEHYNHIPFGVAISSSLQRTIQTLEPFINKGIDHKKHEAIDEIDWGIFEGQVSTAELHQEYRRVLSAWSSGDYAAKIEGGESAKQMADRLLPWVEHLKERDEEKILVCTHGAVMAFLMTILHDQPLSQMPFYKHQNTGLCKFDWNGNRFERQLLNDTRHLINVPT